MEVQIKQFISIPGVPVPFQSPRVYNNRTFNPRHKEKAEFIAKLALCGPLVKFSRVFDIKVSFYFPISKEMARKEKSHLKARKLELAPITDEDYCENSPHEKKPDIDNCIKFLFDCLKNEMFQDDSTVWKLHAQKLYSHLPRTDITIYGD